MQEVLPEGGVIRKLWAGETAKYRDHILRLDPESRRNRFAGGVSDDFISKYVELANSLDSVERDRQIDVIADEIIGYAAGEPVMPALWIEPQHMVAVFFRFSDPQFADHAAFGKNILHSEGLLTLSSMRSLLIASSTKRLSA